MTLAPKPVWTEGMFLRPHHFQQADRRLESMVTARVAAAAPYFWGVAALELDEEALASGRFGLRRCAGAFRDGLPFGWPGEADRLAPLEIDGAAAGRIVQLCAPAEGPGRMAAPRGPGGAPPAARYALFEAHRRNLMDESLDEEPMQLAAPGLFLSLDEAPSDGRVRLPLARIAGLSPTKEVLLDPAFAPTTTNFAVSSWLRRAAGEVAERFAARARTAASYGRVGGAGAGAQEELALLLLCNRWSGRLAQIVGAAAAHPVDLHRELCTAAAELSTFARVRVRGERDEGERLPAPFPAYDHDDPTATFAPVFADLSALLGFVHVERAVRLDLAHRIEVNVHYRDPVPTEFFSGARFVIVATADMPWETLRATFPQGVTIGSTETIRELVRSMDRSVSLRPVEWPRELRPRAGWAAFELEQKSDRWAEIARDRSIALHPQADFARLELELWAIRD